MGHRPRCHRRHFHPLPHRTTLLEGSALWVLSKSERLFVPFFGFSFGLSLEGFFDQLGWGLRILFFA